MASELIQKIPPRDREKIFLSVIFFWLKYIRRNQLQPDFNPERPDVDPEASDIAKICQTFFGLQRQLNADISGQGAVGVAEVITSHPKKVEIFQLLSDSDITSICCDLDDMFENQEFCATCESWSYWDTNSVEKFAIGVAVDILWLCDGMAGIPWFSQIFHADKRDIIVTEIMKHYISQKGRLMLT